VVQFLEIMNLSRKNNIIIVTLAVCVGGAIFLYRPLPLHHSEPIIESLEGTLSSIPLKDTTSVSEEQATTEPVQTPTQAQSSTPIEATTPDLPEFNEESLAEYNGDNPNLPIYIAFEGLVYDVSPGREFYEPGAMYHYFAGTDGTEVLRMVGGDIIQRKYKVIGTFK
jgi:predicted heme/steroid binding protein